MADVLFSLGYCGIYFGFPIFIVALILLQVDRKKSPTGWLVGYCILAFLVTLLSSALAALITDFMVPVSVSVMGIFVIIACNRWKQD